MKLFKNSFKEQKINIQGNSKILPKALIGASLATSLLLMNGTITIPNKVLNAFGLESRYHESKVFVLEDEGNKAKENQYFHLLCLTKEGKYMNEYEEIGNKCDDSISNIYTMMKIDDIDSIVIPIHSFLERQGYDYQDDIGSWYSETQLLQIKSRLEIEREKLKIKERLKIKEKVRRAISTRKDGFKLNEILVLEMYDSEQQGISLHFLYPVNNLFFPKGNIESLDEEIIVYREITHDRYDPIYIKIAGFDGIYAADGKRVDGLLKCASEYEFLKRKYPYGQYGEFDFSAFDLLVIKSQTEDYERQKLKQPSIEDFNIKEENPYEKKLK